MARHHCTSNGNIAYTAEEEAAQDIIDQAWEDGADARIMADVRAMRDDLLAATDWAALPDSPTMSSAMATYRTALRDYPATYTADNEADIPELGAE